MTLSSITQWVSQASSSVVRATSHAQRLGQLAQAARPPENIFRLAANTSSELTRGANALKSLVTLLPTASVTALERSALGRGMASVQAGLADINRATQRIGSLIDTAQSGAKRLDSAVRSVQSAATSVSTQLGALKAQLGSAGATTPLASPTASSTRRAAGTGMPTLSSARPHLLVLVAEQGERFYFGLNTAAFDSLRRQSQYNLATQERLGRPQALQAVNQGGESLTLSGVIFAQMAGMTQLNALRRIGFQMKPVELIAGHGETLGRWYLASVSEDQSDLMADGAPRKQTFTVEFKRYGDDYQNL